MPTPKKGARFGGSPAHQKLILSNLATALFENGRITTTEAKARHLRPVAEKLITKAKKGDLHNRRAHCYGWNGHRFFSSQFLEGNDAHPVVQRGSWLASDCWTRRDC